MTLSDVIELIKQELEIATLEVVNYKNTNKEKDYSLGYKVACEYILNHLEILAKETKESRPK